MSEQIMSTEQEHRDGVHPDPRVGTLLDNKYLLLHKLGDGAMGVVYEARQVQTDIECAVKLLHRQLLTSESSLKRFQNEAALVSKLIHPNITKLRAFGIAGEQPYMVMELVRGKTLAQIIGESSKGLAPARAIELCIQICAGLAEAHANQIIHRDIKPSNIMVCRVGDCEQVKIIDFGVGKILEGGTQRLTVAGDLLGTPFYMSPEQCSTNLADGRSDVYSVGCVLFQMITGIPPFVGTTLVETMSRHVSEQPPQVGLPELDRILGKALQKQPEQRYQSMSEFGAALHSAAISARQPPLKKSEYKPKSNRASKTQVMFAASWLLFLLILVLAFRDPLAATAARVSPSNKQMLLDGLSWSVKANFKEAQSVLRKRLIAEFAATKPEEIKTYLRLSKVDPSHAVADSHHALKLAVESAEEALHVSGSAANIDSTIALLVDTIPQVQGKTPLWELTTAIALSNLLLHIGKPTQAEKLCLSTIKLSESGPSKSYRAEYVALQSLNIAMLRSPTKYTREQIKLLERLFQHPGVDLKKDSPEIIHSPDATEFFSIWPVAQCYLKDGFTDDAKRLLRRALKVADSASLGSIESSQPVLLCWFQIAMDNKWKPEARLVAQLYLNYAEERDERFHSSDSASELAKACVMRGTVLEPTSTPELRESMALYARAVNFYKKAGKESSLDCARARLHYGSILTHFGYDKQALNELLRAKPLLDQIPSAEPITCNVLIGRCYSNMNMNQNAVENFRHAVSRLPNRLSKRDCASVRLEYASALTQAKQYALAETSFETAINQLETLKLTNDPIYYLAWRGRGSNYKAQKRWREALECYEKTQQIKLDNLSEHTAPLQIDMAMCCMNLGQAENARAHVAKALSDPTIVPKHRDLCSSILRQVNSMPVGNRDVAGHRRSV